MQGVKIQTPGLVIGILLHVVISTSTVLEEHLSVVVNVAAKYL